MGLRGWKEQPRISRLERLEVCTARSRRRAPAWPKGLSRSTRDCRVVLTCKGACGRAMCSVRCAHCMPDAWWLCAVECG